MQEKKSIWMISTHSSFTFLIHLAQFKKHANKRAKKTKKTTTPKPLLLFYYKYINLSERVFFWILSQTHVIPSTINPQNSLQFFSRLKFPISLSLQVPPHLIKQKCWRVIKEMLLTPQFCHHITPSFLIWLTTTASFTYPPIYSSAPFIHVHWFTRYPAFTLPPSIHLCI